MSNSEKEFVRSNAAMSHTVTISLDEYDGMMSDCYQLRAIKNTLERIASVTDRNCLQFTDFTGEMEAVLRAVDPLFVECLIRSEREEAAAE